jgi:hypothetical protein
MRALRQTIDLLLSVLGSFGWVLATMWLGGVSLWRAGVLLSRYRQITAEVRLCPRGHEVPQFGLFDCACGSRVEGWVFAKCRVCGESAGWVPCGVCGLPVTNPTIV